MKDLVIKGKFLRRELIVLLVCFIVVNLLNAGAIWYHGTQWSELYNLWYVIIPVTVIVYVLLIPVRFILCWALRGIRTLFRKKKKQ